MAGEGESFVTPNESPSPPTGVSDSPAKPTSAAGALAAMPLEEKLRYYDLTESMSKYWEPDMLRCVLKWLKEKERYPAGEIDEVILKTLMLTYHPDEWIPLQSRRPLDHVKKETQDSENFHLLENQLIPFVHCMTTLRSECKKDPSILSEKKTYKELTAWWRQRQQDVPELGQNPSVTLAEDCGQKLLQFSNFYFLTGKYENSAKWLAFYIDFICEATTEGSNYQRKQSAYWGLLASMILSLPPPIPAALGVVNSDGMVAGDSQNSFSNIDFEENAAQLAVHITKFDEFLESYCANESMNASFAGGGVESMLLGRASSSPQAAPMAAMNHTKKLKDELILRKAWLLHFAVWPLLRYYLPKLSLAGRGSFKRYGAFSDLLEWFICEKNLQTISLVCPHLLRYCAVLAIMNRSREDQFKTVCQVVTQTSSAKRYSDPFTTLLESLFVNFDFDGAQKTLRECSVAAKSDFFLAPLQSAIDENARLVIFETYCRIHKSINIDMIALKLNMTSVAAEKWIVNLIRHAKLDAKIDSERNRVEIRTEPPNIYEQIVENTRNVVARTGLLIEDIDVTALSSKTT